MSHTSQCKDFSILNCNNSSLILVHFETSPNRIEFVDLYDSIWLRLITIVVYIIELLASAICVAFVVYEQDYGHYRTFINQLLSYLYAVVSTF